ncbi:methionyl-tRNA formyltransferase [Aurantimicrobium sp. INA4]|uniref:methionyl-tRNA formyltransferase n=1 Tax=Aurantimicrobium sp. INA4 TaxID=2986279 RepID=UPI0024939424|nr:methionyl-tRNA formyltransferase [Aurantimicrobium sp. INA4]BDU10883.1 methionyl-tRNA formyltransferase [Aurantimicrobium sp. INA4]
MKIIFAGTPEAAVPTLEALISSDFEVVAVLTRPDAPQGRKRILTPSPVAQVAIAQGIPVIYANRIEDEVQKAIEDSAADLGVVVAYGALLPQQTLESVKLGWINLHFSTLPHWRGAAPVQWQVISGASQAGSSVFQLVQELDAGDVYDSREWPILPDETAGELLTRLSVLGARQVLDVVRSIDTRFAEPKPQIGESTYARKLSLEDAHLNLSQDSEFVYNQFRGVTPEPGAFVLIGDERLKIIEARIGTDEEVVPSAITSVSKKLYLGCVTGSLELISVQPAGKQGMSAMDWFRGLRQEVVHVS